MASRKENRYCPDIAIPPGETIQELIDERGMTQSELAECMGRPKKTINEIIKGKAAITPETAIQLERVLGVPAKFWSNLETNYRSDLARIEEAKRLEEQIQWVKLFPIKKMIAYNWISPTDDQATLVDKMLTFFGVASVEAWENKWGREACYSVAFRKSEKCKMNSMALAAWFRKGEIEAQKIKTAKFDSHKLGEAIKELRKLTLESPEVFESEVKRLCAECGVAVVFVKELPNVPAFGVTRWLSTDRVIIQLTLRYKSDDQLWFSFFHELGHVLKHGKRDFVYDETSDSEKAIWEQEANQFALDELISADAYRYFVAEKKFTKCSVQKFAKTQRISPGIVVGRLQHDKKISFSYLNDLKRRFEWA